MTLTHFRSKLSYAFVFLIFVPGFSMDIKIKEINIQISLTTAIFVIFLFLCFLLLIFKTGDFIGSATIVTYTLCFKFVLSLIDPILGLDSMPLI